MASIAKIFGRVLLLALGVTIVFVSISHHLIEIFIVLDVIMVIIGIYLLIISFLNSEKTTKLQKFQKNLTNSIIGNSQEDLKNNILQSNNPNSDTSKNNKYNIINRNNNRNNGKKTNIVSNLGNNLANANNKLNPIDTETITEKIKNVSKSKDPKSILKPKKPKSNINNKKLNFIPNYERSMKVTRRPKKRTNRFQTTRLLI